MSARISMIALLIVTTALPVYAATWYVKPDGTGDTATIQDAIDASADGDTVLLSEGTFTGNGNRKLNFNTRKIVLISENGPNYTIIDGEGNGKVIKIDKDQGSETVVFGLTIKNGDAGNKDGGGIFINGASPTVENNVIMNCSARHGGGIFIKTGSPTLIQNTIVGNSASQEGGGITADGASPLLQYNIIAYNTGGGAVGTRNGATPFYECGDIFSNAGGDSVAGGVDLGNNSSGDPEFCGIAGSGFYWLQSDSPCAQYNAPCGVRVGALDVGCATVDAEERSWGSIKDVFK